jgi:glutamate synthase domain-containing protein 2
MMTRETFDLVHTVLSTLAYLFVLLVGLAVLLLLVVYLLDVTQTRQALRRNYPVVAHFRYFFEHLGTFFRQYFFAMDREEMPFNRAQRNWVYRAAKNTDTTQAFGSTRDIHQPGALIFVNCPFPTLGTDAAPVATITIGNGCRHPYAASSLFNISGMSYGALSKPAVQALSRGAKRAGCWLNTGEGGLSPWHLESGCDLVFQIGTAKYGVRDAEGNLCDTRLRAIAADHGRHADVRRQCLQARQTAL